MTEESEQGDHHWWNDIHQGDAAETLAEMPESSVHCVMTSPPYYGLRDYGVDDQIGLENSLSEYIDTIVDVGDELARVLRDDGSWWLNLGDSFTSKRKQLVPHRVAIALQDAGWIVRADCVWSKSRPMPHPVKDRLNEHKEFVFHLTQSTDYWFDLDAVREPHSEASFARIESAKSSGKYTAGKQMMATPRESAAEHSMMDPDDACHPNGKNPGDVFEVSTTSFPEAHFAVYPSELCETPLKATAPPTVCADCGTPNSRSTDEMPLWERDRSAVDRKQAQRALELFEESDLDIEHLKAARATGFTDAAHGQEQDGAGRNTEGTEQLAAEAKEVLGGYFREFVSAPEREAVGWQQNCDCTTDETNPGVVLDPFAGAGTTCLVAKQLGRRFVGVELNPEYVAMAQKRIGVTVDEPELLLDDGETSLAAFADGGEV